VVLVSHEFQDDDGGLLAALQKDLAQGNAKAKAEIQLLFTKLSRKLVSQALGTTVPTAVASKAAYNQHVSNAMLNSMSFNQLDFDCSGVSDDGSYDDGAESTTDDGSRRGLAASKLPKPKGKGVVISYNVTVSVNAAAMATKGQLSTSNQVAGSLNKEYSNPANVDAALKTVAAATQKAGYKKPSGAKVSSSSKLVAALAAADRRRLSDGSEPYPISRSSVSSSYVVVHDEDFVPA
jgi:hypothetical protein